MTSTPGAQRELAEAAWRWVLDQVRWDDGPWIPETVTSDRAEEPPELRDGMHSGIGGLAHVLAEIREARAWTAEEKELAEAIATRLRSRISTEVECSWFDGLPSTIGALIALREPGAEKAVDRLAGLASPDGWPQSFLQPPRHLPDARISDATLGTAGVLLEALWARRHGIAGATRVAEHAAQILLAEAEERSPGLAWLMAPRRFTTTPPPEMPNWSHGTAGIAAALACAGVELGRPELVDAARAGAEHLIAIGDAGQEGFVVPIQLPPPPDREPVTYTWCHGPTGTSSLFLALDRAGVDEVAGASPLAWHRRCLHSVRSSGLPARLRPGFWDNDGRCCGTASVGEVFLDAWQRTGEEEHLAFASLLADALLEGAVHDGGRACWRFVEHRNAVPLLPPGVGYMQGAAGIAAFLFRISRVSAQGRGAAAVPRSDNWWALPGQ
ncbi:MAG TPA: lanthionine synthetase LanC family protein [Marmoricola sp.]|nr:lanthionine synthetase LanC family protein [Marmoricola sp.]